MIPETMFCVDMRSGYDSKDDVMCTHKSGYDSRNDVLCTHKIRLRFQR